MKGGGLRFGLRLPLDVDSDEFLGGERGVAGSDRVDDFLVKRPDLVPLHSDDGARAALGDDELLQTFDSHSSAHDAADGGETGIVPEEIRMKFDSRQINTATNHPSTCPSSTNHVSFLLLITVFVIFNRAYSHIWGLRSPSASKRQK